MAEVAALIICDSAVLTRGLWTLVNAFDELYFDEFPATHPGFDVITVLKDMKGQETMDIELESVDFLEELDNAANAVVWYDMVEVQAERTPRKEWLRFRTKEVSFNQPGVFEIRVLLNGEILETGAIRARRYQA